MALFPVSSAWLCVWACHQLPCVSSAEVRTAPLSSQPQVSSLLLITPPHPGVLICKMEIMLTPGITETMQ